MAKLEANLKIKGEEDMNVNEYLMDEMKRLNRLNDNLEKNINKGIVANNEPDQIVNNIKVMCNIADILF